MKDKKLPNNKELEGVLDGGNGSSPMKTADKVKFILLLVIGMAV